MRLLSWSTDIQFLTRLMMYLSYKWRCTSQESWSFKQLEPWKTLHTAYTLYEGTAMLTVAKQWLIFVQAGKIFASCSTGSWRSSKWLSLVLKDFNCIKALWVNNLVNYQRSWSCWFCLWLNFLVSTFKTWIVVYQRERWARKNSVRNYVFSRPEASICTTCLCSFIFG